jgi:hypothetical protein
MDNLMPSRSKFSTVGGRLRKVPLGARAYAAFSARQFGESMVRAAKGASATLSVDAGLRTLEQEVRDEAWGESDVKEMLEQRAREVAAFREIGLRPLFLKEGVRVAALKEGEEIRCLKPDRKVPRKSLLARLIRWIFD